MNSNRNLKELISENEDRLSFDNIKRIYQALQDEYRIKIKETANEHLNIIRDTIVEKHKKQKSSQIDCTVKLLFNRNVWDVCHFLSAGGIEQDNCFIKLTKGYTQKQIDYIAKTIREKITGGSRQDIIYYGGPVDFYYYARFMKNEEDGEKIKKQSETHKSKNGTVIESGPLWGDFIAELKKQCQEEGITIRSIYCVEYDNKDVKKYWWRSFDDEFNRKTIELHINSKEEENGIHYYKDRYRISLGERSFHVYMKDRTTYWVRPRYKGLLKNIFIEVHYET